MPDNMMADGQEPCESLYDADPKSYHRRMKDYPDLFIASGFDVCKECGGIMDPKTDICRKCKRKCS